MGRSGFSGQAEAWEQYLTDRTPHTTSPREAAAHAGTGVVVAARKKRDDPEHREAVALMQLVDARTNIYPKLALLYHQDNGRATKAQAGKKKAEGVKPGVADYFLPVAKGGYHGLYIELKAPGERPTPDQIAFLRAVRLEGFAADWIVGGLGAWLIIEDYLLEHYEARPL